MSETFKIGDVVILKSGGPKMTITSVGKDNFGAPTVWCSWFIDKKNETGSFPIGAVKMAD